MERSFQIHINSRNAIILEGGSISDCWYDLPNKTISPENEILISIIHAVIPFSWYNISNTNNILNIFIHNTYYTIAIPEGNYTGISLAKQINQQILAINNTSYIYNFLCSYDVKTSKVIFTNSFLIYIDPTCSICSVIGSSFVTNTVPFLFSIISTTPINLIPHQCVCIAAPNIETENIHVGISQHYRNVLASIPVDVSPMGMIIFKNHNNFRVNTGTNYLNQINIKLIDQDGNLIDLNGQHYSICLQFDIIDYTV